MSRNNNHYAIQDQNGRFAKKSSMYDPKGIVF